MLDLLDLLDLLDWLDLLLERLCLEPLRFLPLPQWLCLLHELFLHELFLHEFFLHEFFLHEFFLHDKPLASRCLPKWLCPLLPQDLTLLEELPLREDDDLDFLEDENDFLDELLCLCDLDERCLLLPLDRLRRLSERDLTLLEEELLRDDEDRLLLLLELELFLELELRLDLELFLL